MDKQTGGARGLFVRCDENTLEALRDFNTAIDALYRLDVCALSAMEHDFSTDVRDQLRILGIDYSDMASRLSLARSLIFGDMLDWNVLQESDAAP